jgi:RNA-binding protein YhbY
MTTDKRTLRERSHGIDATVRIGNPGIESPAERMDAESIETCGNTATYY